MKLQAMSGNKGFTLIELVLVMGLSATIGAMGIGMGLASTAKNICDSEFVALRSLLFQARNMSATSGVAAEISVDFENLTDVDALAQGFFASSQSDSFPENTVRFSKSELGVRSASSSVVLSGPSCEKTININNVGAIIY